MLGQEKRRNDRKSKRRRRREKEGESGAKGRVVQLISHCPPRRPLLLPALSFWYSSPWPVFPLFFPARESDWPLCVSLLHQPHHTHTHTDIALALVHTVGPLFLPVCLACVSGRREGQERCRPVQTDTKSENTRKQGEKKTCFCCSLFPPKACFFLCPFREISFFGLNVNEPKSPTETGLAHKHI